MHIHNTLLCPLISYHPIKGGGEFYCYRRRPSVVPGNSIHPLCYYYIYNNFSKSCDRDSLGNQVIYCKKKCLNERSWP